MSESSTITLLFIAIAGIPLWIFIITKVTNLTTRAARRAKIRLPPELMAWPRKSPFHFVATLLGLVVLLVIGCAACVAASLTAGMPFHNYQLTQYDRAFRSIQHPPDSTLVKSRKAIALGPVNGSCGYFIGELRKYSGSKQEVQTFYSGQTTLGKVTLVFVEKADDLLTALKGYYTVDDLSDWQIAPSDFQKNLYLIYFYDYGDSFFDIRCE